MSYGEIADFWKSKRPALAQASTKLWLEEQGYVPAFWLGYSVEGKQNPGKMKVKDWESWFEGELNARFQRLGRDTRLHLCMALVVEKTPDTLASHVVALARKDDWITKSPEEHLENVNRSNCKGWRWSVKPPHAELYDVEKGGAAYSSAERHTVLYVRKKFCPRSGSSMCKRQKCPDDHNQKA